MSGYYQMLKDAYFAAKYASGKVLDGLDRWGTKYPINLPDHPYNRQFAPTVKSGRYIGNLSARVARGGVKTYTKQKSKKGSKKTSGYSKIKREQYMMKKQLRQLPPAPKDIILDQVSDRWTSAQGLAQWQSSAGTVTKNAITNVDICLAPTNVNWMLSSIPLVDLISSFTKGRSKYIRHEWSLDTRMTNLSNCPIELECYALKTRKRVMNDQDAHSGFAPGNTFSTLLGRLFYNQYNVDTVTSPSKGQSHPSFKLTDLARFNEFFKIVSCKRNVVQPGEALLIKKYSKRARMFDSALQYNANGGVNDLQVWFEKGEMLYVYRQLGVPQSQESKTAADVTLCDTAMDVVHNLRARISVLPYATYDAVLAPGQLATGQTIKLIFPGTSAAGTAAPAT